MTSRKALIARVEAGAAWLDQCSPGWRDHVTLCDLDIAASCRCVLGQLFAKDADAAGYEDGFDYAGSELLEFSDGNRFFQLGFDYDSADVLDAKNHLAILTELWTMKIKGEDLA